jgi:CheY-like chemotaxis protein
VERERRIVTRCNVEFERGGQRTVAETEDLSLNGAFVRTEALLPVGAVVSLTLRVATGAPVVVVSRVVHALGPAAAALLGRSPGIGLAFLEHTTEGRDGLRDYLDHVAELAPDRIAMPGQAFAIVADPSAPRRERIVNALGAIGFESLVFEGATAALDACGEFTPDVVVAPLEMPDLDGVSLLARMRARPALCDVPVVLLDEPGADLERLQAFRMGVRDVVSQPFTDEELCIRVRRAALEARRSPSEPVLRGELGEISLGTLLSLFEFERKSGVLLVFGDEAAARLSVASGRIVRVDAPGTEEDEARPFAGLQRLMRVLDWVEGRFEFTAGPVLPGLDEVGMSTSEVLLEHARQKDERDERE